ncbi:gamma-glutamyl-gamma-aminobutyrate hydrolase family protein [Aestuariibius sp. 2305UL40-4]|uniref:gamma-glutamyl-gamma-aminobutyrate hydrolase family protein n=1 Tax=Aestuariibius violaceus TaxID=3234132 RepID=UPI00345E72E1
MKPTIGVTVSQRSGWRIFPLVAFNVWLAGGRAIRWQADRDVDVDAVDGVIIGGGDDISPDLYGMEPVISARLDPARDALERQIVEHAWKTNTPLLGICRGSQMINVVLGGDLDQDAYKTFGSRKYKTVLPRKTVTVEEDTRLAGLVGPQPMKVNALHSQAVCALGRGLRVAARDDGGMIQSVERIRDPYMLGVQWHPEHLFYARRQRRIFSALIAAARAYHEERDQLAGVDIAVGQS